MTQECLLQMTLECLQTTLACLQIPEALLLKTTLAYLQIPEAFLLKTILAYLQIQGHRQTTREYHQMILEYHQTILEAHPDQMGTAQLQKPEEHLLRVMNLSQNPVQENLSQKTVVQVVAVC